MLGLRIMEGRFISTEIAADTFNNFVVNESFIREYAIEEPVIGTKIKFSFEPTYGQIIGVVEDFHYRGLSHPIKPLIITGRPDRWFASIKLSTANLSSIITAIEGLWQKVEPAHPVQYSFLDDDFALQYAENQRFGKNMQYATILTILIACLGLFGLATFAARKRTKEIGVQKVLGASASDVVGLLGKDFNYSCFCIGHSFGLDGFAELVGRFCLPGLVGLVGFCSGRYIGFCSGLYHGWL